MKNLIASSLSTTLLVLLASTPLAFGQPGPGTGFRGGNPPAERPELPPEIRQDAVDYRAEQLAIRAERAAAVQSFLAENPAASREEVRAFIEAWNQENAERLLAQQAAREALREDIREAAPDLPEDVKADMAAYRSEAERLREGRRAAVTAFMEANPGASPEEIRAEVQAYNVANAEAIRANLALGQSIREELRSLRPTPQPLDRSAAREQLRGHREQVADRAEQVRQQRQELNGRERLTPAERREWMRANAELLRAEREAIRKEIEAESNSKE